MTITRFDRTLARLQSEDFHHLGSGFQDVAGRPKKATGSTCRAIELVHLCEKGALW
ncbi:hypothetical protein Brsp01_42210 [Brucella sp. NBRC 12950]|jgi:hypothetical protein|nr:hypothetical protein Brsp01_42210 [Brucella sp. NBRC 12950]